jgi:hypothetical protein
MICITPPSPHVLQMPRLRTKYSASQSIIMTIIAHTISTVMTTSKKLDIMGREDFGIFTSNAWGIRMLGELGG